MSQVNIDDVLPHRDRMRLIDEAIRVDSNTAVTASTVSETWPLFHHNAVDAMVLIELVAQTAGICFGWRERQKRGSITEGMGWLVGIKEAKFFRETLPLGSRIITAFKRGFDFENYHEVLGQAKMDDVLIAEIHLQIMESEPVKGDGNR
jgi:predicted hotdog family 3-hydroxylacyl-ACP dehydratase